MQFHRPSADETFLSALRKRCLLAMGLLSFLFGCGSQPDSGPFVLKDGRWSYLDASVESPDPGSFKPLSEHYAKDSQQAYYADTYRLGQEYYTVRHSRVKVLRGADAASFVYLDRDIAKDKAFIYVEGQAAEVKDVASFELLRGHYARDRLRGYHATQEIAGSDGPSFQVFDTNAAFARDARHVYFARKYRTGGEIAPDDRLRRLPRVRIDTFQPLQGGFAKDAGQAYHGDTVLTKSPASFQALDQDYAKTETQVWFRDKLLRGADAASFELVTDAPGATVDARDARGAYRMGERLPEAAPTGPSPPSPPPSPRAAPPNSPTPR